MPDTADTIARAICLAAGRMAHGSTGVGTVERNLSAALRPYFPDGYSGHEALPAEEAVEVAEDDWRAAAVTRGDLSDALSGAVDAIRWHIDARTLPPCPNGDACQTAGCPNQHPRLEPPTALSEAARALTRRLVNMTADGKPAVGPVQSGILARAGRDYAVDHRALASMALDGWQIIPPDTDDRFSDHGTGREL